MAFAYLFCPLQHCILSSGAFGGFIPYLMCEISRERETELGLHNEDHVLITSTVTHLVQPRVIIYPGGNGSTDGSCVDGEGRPNGNEGHALGRLG